MDYVAAGFDPSSFFHLTPRAYRKRMDAARLRDRTQMVLIARAVWSGTHLASGDLQAWCAELLGQDMRLPPEALAGTLAKASSGMRKMTWAEALKERPHGNS